MTTEQKTEPVLLHQPEPPVLITLPEVCRLLSISEPTAYRMQKEGLLRAVRIPGRRSTRYRRSEVLQIVG